MNVLYSNKELSLLEISFSVKQRLGCSCSYTLADAEALESEVQKWCKAVPYELLLAFKHGIIGTSAELVSLGAKIYDVEEDTSPGITPQAAHGLATALATPAHPKAREDDGSGSFKSSRLESDDRRDDDSPEVVMRQTVATTHTSSRILGCELALMVQNLIVNIYSPLATHLTPPPSNKSTSHPLSPAVQKIVDASQAIIRIAKILSGLLEPTLPSTSSLVAKSPLLSMCSLERFVLNATLICCRVCIGEPVDGAEAGSQGMDRQNPRSNEVMQSISIGLDLLESVYSPAKHPHRALGLSRPAFLDGYSQEPKVIAALRKRWSAKMASLSPPQQRLKRTRSVMEETRGRNSRQAQSVSPTVELPPPIHTNDRLAVSTPPDRSFLHAVDRRPSTSAFVEMPSPPVPSDAPRVGRSSTSVKHPARNRGTLRVPDNTLAAKVAERVEKADQALAKGKRSRSVSSHSSSMSTDVNNAKFSVRSRRLPEGKKKEVSQSPFTMLPRVFKDGKMVYEPAGLQDVG